MYIVLSYQLSAVSVHASSPPFSVFGAVEPDIIIFADMPDVAMSLPKVPSAAHCESFAQANPFGSIITALSRAAVSLVLFFI